MSDYSARDKSGRVVFYVLLETPGHFARVNRRLLAQRPRAGPCAAARTVPGTGSYTSPTTTAGCGHRSPESDTTAGGE